MATIKIKKTSVDPLDTVITNLKAVDEYVGKLNRFKSTTANSALLYAVQYIRKLDLDLINDTLIHRGYETVAPVTVDETFKLSALHNSAYVVPLEADYVKVTFSMSGAID